MFESINIHAIVAQALQVMAWTLAQMPAWQADAERVLWEQSPWWMRALIVITSLESTYLVARRVLVFFGVLSRGRRANKRFHLTR